MTGTIGVAISTTGDEHRIGFLETCVAHWKRVLPLGSVLVVTVDGSADDARLVDIHLNSLLRDGGVIYRVGRPAYPGDMDNQHRLGVAVNKNTGLELLMDHGVEHLFLSDDDCWPLIPQALDKHIELDLPHSMVCWGKSRLGGIIERGRVGTWTWPRGVMLYAQRSVVERVGGMDERFGPGGHEHVEWSQRIHRAGFTPAPFISPASYTLKGVSGNPATRADALWHCEDMRQPGEMPHEWDARKKRNTTIRRSARDWGHIDNIMAERQGSSDFVSFRAHENGRASATLCSSSSCAVEPETPRSEK